MTYRVQLDNGLRIVGEEISSIRSVSFGIWVRTGSRYEAPSENGISHFLEHMFFKGTSRYSAKELAHLFDDLGGQVNAFTAKEYTCFYARVLDEHFATALDTLADMLLGSTFAPVEIEKEKRVVIEEIHMYEDTPDELVMDLIADGVYGDHPLGYTILGREENLQRFTREDLLSYVHRHYQPANMVVAVAGHVDEATVVREVERLFGGMATATADRSQLLVPPFRKGVTVREKDIEQVHICLASPGYPAGRDELYPLLLLNNMLGGTQSSRLFQEIREERGMAYSVYSFHTGYQDAGMFGVYVGTSPETAEQVLQLVQSVCDDMWQSKLASTELEKAKRQVKGALMLGLESSGSRMSRIAKNELLLGRDVPIEETIAGIEAVTPEAIQTVAQQVLSSGFAIAAVGPLAGIDLEGSVKVCASS
ncbi:putative Zn-dependent peptidase [Alicyclobacillus sacchari]|uniref:Putative Zn-dependent peptidase n=1 Tax=Alicyclobacillus sacchari TaxID=392010 RepID=A0A4R8LSA4_9BACL|nr:pitrilysin family protein [Alicyclobacillus sacchari]TDY50529.1 putative Zn-dependent peptidase [Alicyclobacillus sacchari]GMA59071.1 putative zinc protease YmxG [Alicyclobacillus sacchari]